MCSLAAAIRWGAFFFSMELLVAAVLPVGSGLSEEQDGVACGASS